MSEQARSLRELAQDGTLDLADFWVAFWQGLFEGAGKTKLLICPPSYGTPVAATREEVLLLNALGAAEIRAGNAGSEKIYELLAECLYADVHPTFRWDFEGMLIPESELEKLRAGPDDSIGLAIKRVLREAARIAEQGVQSNRAIARQLVAGRGRFAGYSESTIRQILDGRFRPQRARRIHDLHRWRASNP